jgi:hypothetical protein
MTAMRTVLLFSLLATSVVSASHSKRFMANHRTSSQIIMPAVYNATDHRCVASISEFPNSGISWFSEYECCVDYKGAIFTCP